MSVQEYLDKHTLSRKIEDAVNAAVRAKTPDPVLFISNHLKKSVPSVITNLKARQILDSRGIPTVEVDLRTNKGVFRASAPSGSTSGMIEPLSVHPDADGNSCALLDAGVGTFSVLQIVVPVQFLSLFVEGSHLVSCPGVLRYEAVELRDGDKGMYLGNGVSRAVKNVNEKISEALIGMDPTLQAQIDQAMIDLDKTDKKVPLYKHIADLAGKTSYHLPVPAFTLIGGGNLAGNNLAIQEIMILPVGAKKFEEALQMGAETYHHLKFKLLKEGLDFVKEAIGRTGYNEKIKIAIGVGATEFCIGTKYDLDYKTPNRSGQNFKSGEDMIDMYKELCAAYPIVSIEDPFDKEDWEHSKYFSSLGICQIRSGFPFQVVGDDLLMSNPKRIERAVQETACNALLLKVNQVGTVTEAIEAVKLAKDANWGVVISQRSGESEDSFLADIAVGLATGQIKAGAPCRGERLAKYNQLVRIEEELGDQAIYAGDDWKHF
ncbi:hypothetical protein SASPL_120156 [Salvia splendens]|uniref:phosphopyruvate hydratase n=1 Tax=Salvia splendens TaxID=180675 RepID=A0A8X8ZVY9_SALSN|nr:hypothetical protein SASPL_120156 [Salvia splendens]